MPRKGPHARRNPTPLPSVLRVARLAALVLFALLPAAAAPRCSPPSPPSWRYDGRALPFARLREPPPAPSFPEPLGPLCSLGLSIPTVNAREAYRRDLLARLPANVVDSAMKRLDEAIALARRYEEEGKVVSAAEVTRIPPRRAGPRRARLR